ncbi:MAG: hypothetical protein DRO12_05330 [Thermoprotei archaeon]|nr:MAG: hypothetical protein DRO12_05330 [Thermoprotei archaeon]
MTQQRLSDYLKVEECSKEKKLQALLKKLSDRYSIQYALVWYIYLKNSAEFRDIYRSIQVSEWKSC